MEIKIPEGQTLLSLLRVAIYGLAALSVFGMHNFADACFDIVHNGGDSVSSYGQNADANAYGRPYTLYYEQNAGNKGVSYIYKQYYITGKEGALGLVDSAGKVLIPQQYEDIIVLPSSYILKEDELWHFYNNTDITLLNDNAWDNVEISLDENGKINNELVKVEKDGLFGATDQQGNIIVNPAWDDFDPSTYSVDWPIIRVKKDGHYGYINSTGDIVITVSYDYAQLDVYTIPAEDEDTRTSEPTTVPIVYVNKDGDWGGIFRINDNESSQVHWDIEPSAEVMADYEKTAI